ncbi:hypothetical protein ACROYT_G006657 [Oculina patagonica]
MAVVDAWETTSAAELRSFLGLVKFTAPLHQLSKNGEPFVWGLEQQKSCEELKKQLSRAETLRYFDKNAPTKVPRILQIPCHASCNQWRRQKMKTKQYVRWVTQESTPVALTTCEIERASEHDPELQSVRECLLNGKWHAIEFKEYLPV